MATLVAEHAARETTVPTAEVPRGMFAPLGAAALLALAARLLTGPRTIDDAYITFRYARNLAEGVGLVYNSGEWVLGTTTPLWALVLAGGYTLGAKDLPTLAWLLGALFDAGTAALLAHLAIRAGLGALGAFLVGAAWALNPMSAGFAASGMETSLFILLAVAALTLTATNRPLPGCLLAGISVGVRPEGLLVAAACVLPSWLKARRPVATPTLAAGIPVAVLLGLLTVAYGSPLPQTVWAKQAAYATESPLGSLFVLVVHAGLPGWSNYFSGVLPIFITLPLALVAATLVLVLAVRAVRHWPIDGVAWLPYVLFAGLYFAFHAVSGLRGGRLFPWYLVPLNAAYLLLAAMGARTLLGQRHRWLPGLVLLLWQLPAIDWQRPFLPTGFDLRREVLYREVGAQLARDYPPFTVVAAPEIGALGWTSGLRVLDTVGLVSPGATPYYPLPREMVDGDNAIPPHLITDTRPDLVVTLDQFARRSLLPDPEFQRRYELVHRTPAPIWLSTELLVYRRVD